MKRVLLLLLCGSWLYGQSIGPGSTTYQCIDHDGDGYGTGPGCTGPDADDSDATVNTYATVVSKYGGADDLATLKNIWAHLTSVDGIARSPAHYIFVSTSGTDGSACALGQSGDAANSNLNHPCATNGGALAKTANGRGDAIIYRSGTYTQSSPADGGNCGGGSVSLFCAFQGLSTQYQMEVSYPGEQAILSSGSDRTHNGLGISTSNGAAQYELIDGLIVQGPGGGISQTAAYGLTSNAASSIRCTNNTIIQNVEVTGFNDLIWIQSCQSNVTIQNSVLHDGTGGSDPGGGHGMYLGASQPGGRSPATAVVQATGWTVKGNIVYHLGGNCLHMNGWISGSLIDGNFMYGCGKSGNGTNPLNFQNGGLQNSTVQNNVTWTGAGPSLAIINYADGSSVIPNGPMNHNTIRSNTFHFDHTYWDTGGSAGCNLFAPIWVQDWSGSGSGSNPSGVSLDMGHNTYVNNAATNDCSTVGDSWGARYDTDVNGNGGALWLATDTWQNNDFYDANMDWSNSANKFVGICSYASHSNGCSSPAPTTQNYSWFTSNAGTASGNVVGNPDFAAAGTYSSGATWNLALSGSGSAAWQAASSANIPVFDIRNVARGTTPDIGAYQSSTAASGNSVGTAIVGTVSISGGVIP